MSCGLKPSRRILSVTKVLGDRAHEPGQEGVTGQPAPDWRLTPRPRCPALARLGRLFCSG
jgi:hypothetical protein